ncbi:MAG: rhomboid family intramembrane serine protease [Chloroflexota bacterium]
MLPLNDVEPNRYSPIPFMTIGIILLNVLIFIFGPWPTWDNLMVYAFTPRLILQQEGLGVLSSVMATFMHGGLFHLVGNMFPLWVFGRRVEDACGPWRFLLYYLLAGSLAHIVTLLVFHDDPIPSLGASGAIFGVMGAYLVLYPEGRIRTLVLFTPIPLWPRIRAVWVIFYFLGVQIIPAIEVAFENVDYNIGYWAHLGGFAASIFIYLFLRPEAFARYLSNTQV